MPADKRNEPEKNATFAEIKDATPPAPTITQTGEVGPGAGTPAPAPATPPAPQPLQIDAEEFLRVLGRSNPIADAAPPPSKETVEGGRFRVGRYIRDAHGNVLEDLGEDANRPK